MTINWLFRPTHWTSADNCHTPTCHDTSSALQYPSSCLETSACILETSSACILLWSPFLSSVGPSKSACSSSNCVTNQNRVIPSPTIFDISKEPITDVTSLFEPFFEPFHSLQMLIGLSDRVSICFVC